MEGEALGVAGGWAPWRPARGGGGVECARGRGSRESWGWPVRPTEIQFSAYLFPIQSSLFNLQMLQLMEINLTPNEATIVALLATCVPPPPVRDQRHWLGRLGRLGLPLTNVRYIIIIISYKPYFYTNSN